MAHVVLLGDSIFDNARYVPGGPSVIEHLRTSLPPDGKATLLAVDGSVAEDVARQLRGLPDDATHLVISTGGNNALGYSGLILQEPAGSFLEVLSRLAAIREEFEESYRSMLQVARETGLPVAVCTIYDAIPGLAPAHRSGLCLFNDTIMREAARAGMPVIDLRLICTNPADYAPSSPIEPSAQGGGKIARAVGRVVTSHDFATAGCRVYA